MVTDDVAREAGQDRREGGAPRELYHVPTGRSRDISRCVRRHPEPVEIYKGEVVGT